MNPQNEQSDEDELAERLWHAIAMIQGMTDRLLTQYEKTLRGQAIDAYSLANLVAG